ncbi:MAG: nucleotidyltransferase domain-containing protein [Bacteroidetes bacterium]|nr:nucleotidyltransferase domain-containing protein [Bacteroidota bacterium]
MNLVFGLKERVVNQIREVFSHYPQVTEVVIYGSRAMGNFRNGSDIDLTLKGDDLNLTVLGKIDLELDDLLLPYTFDLSIYNQIDNPDLIDHINRVGKVFFLNK